MLSSQPTSTGHFGPYGGKFVPEVLMSPLEELENTFLEARQDPKFQAEFTMRSGSPNNWAARGFT
jgi:tryptophan synthase beta chain